MSTHDLVQSYQELSFGFFAEWLKRQMAKFTKKTPEWVGQQPSVDLDFEGFKALVEGAISAPVFFQEDSMGFYAQGQDFSIEMEDGAMRCLLKNREVSFRKLIAEVR